MLLLEQNDEWLVGRRYLSETSMALILANTTRDDQAHNPKEVPELTASRPLVIHRRSPATPRNAT
jgi:hypothetical protein